MSSVRRGRTHRLLCPAVVALGAGGGMAFVGALAFDAAPAGAQTMTSTAPHHAEAPASPTAGAPRAQEPAPTPPARPHESPQAPTASRLTPATAPPAHGNGNGNGQGHDAQSSQAAGGDAGASNGRVGSNGSSHSPCDSTGPGTAHTGSGAGGNGRSTRTGGSGGNAGNGSPTGQGNPGSDNGSGPSANAGTPGSAGGTNGAPGQSGSPDTPPGQTSGPRKNPAPPAATDTATLVVAHIPSTAAVRPLAPFTLSVRARPRAAGPSGPSGPTPSPLGGPTIPGLALPDINRRWLNFPENLNQGIGGASLKAANKEKFPLAFLGIAGLFLLAQGLIDRRDPKLSRAPEHQREDSVEFE